MLNHYNLTSYTETKTRNESPIILNLSEHCDTSQSLEKAMQHNNYNVVILNGCDELYDTDLAPLQKLNNLTELHLAGCEKIDGKHLNKLSLFNKLKILDISNTSMTTDHFRNFMSNPLHCPNLKKLIIADENEQKLIEYILEIKKSRNHLVVEVVNLERYSRDFICFYSQHTNWHTNIDDRFYKKTFGK